MTEMQDGGGPCLTTRYPVQSDPLSSAGTGGVRSPLSSWPWLGDGLPPGCLPGIISQGQGRARTVAGPETHTTCRNTRLLTTVV